MLKTAILAAALLCAAMVSACAETCIASQYGVGDGYHGKPVACRGLGKLLHDSRDGIFNTHATNPYTTAYPNLKKRPCGSFVTITNLRNGKSIRAMVTDHGPHIRGRCVDLGRAGANAIGMGGLAPVRVE